MSNKINVKIITPEKLLFEETADRVSLPTKDGFISVLPRHVPIIVELKSGDIVVTIDGESVPFAVLGGFAEVRKNPEGLTEIAILADFAESVSGMTDDAIEFARARAAEIKKQMENKETVDFEHFEAELERSLNRVKIADKWRTKKYRK